MNLKVPSGRPHENYICCLSNNGLVVSNIGHCVVKPVSLTPVSFLNFPETDDITARCDGRFLRNGRETYSYKLK